ncbi:FACT complex subunit spt16, partial [Coemansia sp. RSA 2703]
MWLLGYEFPNTLILFTKDKIYVVASQKKAKILEPLKNTLGGVPIEIFVHGKDVAKNQEFFSQTVSAIKSSGAKLGVISNDKPSGKMVDEWDSAFAPSAAGLEKIDVSSTISGLLSVKEESEI